MGDPLSLAPDLVKEAWKIVKKGLEYESTAQELENMENQLRPMFEEIEELARKMNLPAAEIENLNKIMREMREALLKYSKLECWKCCLKPCYKNELDKADKSIKDFISYRLTVQTARTVMQIQYRIETGVHNDTHYRQPTLKIDMETLIFEEFVGGLNTPLMETLKSGLMEDGGDKVLNLNGLTGTGKTTLALQLCLDPQVRGWFNGNISFEPEGSQIKRNGEQWMNKLGSELREKWSDNKGLLVVDEVEPGSQHLFRYCLRQLPSNSKILVISRVALQGLGRQVPMTLLCEQDAVTLLSHFVRPIGAATVDLPDHRILRQVAERCGGFPMAIKMIGRYLQENQKPEFWHQFLRDWQGRTTLDTDTKLLDHLHNSLRDSDEFKAISEFFMDLTLFPKHEIVPVSALLDMWIELYNQDEDGIVAMTSVHRLTAMNLADKVVQTRVTGSSVAEDEVDNQFLMQHNILRELANRYLRDQGRQFVKRRLSIEINGNDHPPPECFPQLPQRVINSCLAPFKASILQRGVAAHLLSITTDQNVTPEDLPIQASKAEVLVLNLRTNEYGLPKVITKMKNLKVLIVTNYGIEFTQLGKSDLLGSFKTLRRIRLQHVTVPCEWKLKSLRKLSLYTCLVNMAFGNSSMEFSEAMPNLVELKIDDNTDLVELPSGLYNIINLKKLSITKCRNFIKLSQEISKLKNLELLRISHCDKFEDMPESISELQSLTFLDITRCRILQKLPDNIGQLQNLADLHMPGCLNIVELPDTLVNLTNLRKVVCDEYTSGNWQLIKESIGSDLEIKIVSSMP